MNNEKIPKKIHYCWLGKNKKPESVIRCIKSWKRYLPDYEIIEWTEDNFEFQKCENKYVTEALKNKKWAFVTDYMRLYILYTEGGIYLDTDVEIIRNLDEFLNFNSFLGFESNNTVCTAIIGASKSQVWIKELLVKYNQRRFVLDNGKFDMEPNSRYIYRFLVENYKLSKCNKINILNGDIHIYPCEYFSPKNYTTMKMKVTDKTYTIHHYNGMWKSFLQKVKDYILALITRIIGEENREILRKKLKEEM